MSNLLSFAQSSENERTHTHYTLMHMHTYRMKERGNRTESQGGGRERERQRDIHTLHRGIHRHTVTDIQTYRHTDIHTLARISGAPDAADKTAARFSTCPCKHT